MDYFFLREERGFTLVEVLIVIILISVLTAVGITSYIGIRSRASESATESEMRNIATALEVYKGNNDFYPTSSNFPEELESSGYMDNVPGEDAWENPYSYACEDGTEYVLKSSGEDRSLDTGDDIAFENGVMTENGAY